jgi:ketosteroid isomerase-like protein
MSEENVEVVRRMHEAYFRGDFENAMSAFAEDVVWQDQHGTYHGHEGVAQSTARWTGAWEDLHQEVDDILDTDGDDVVLLLRQSARGKASGAPVESVFGWIYTVTGGKISRVRLFPDADQALKAAGLSDSDS